MTSVAAIGSHRETRFISDDGDENAYLVGLGGACPVIPVLRRSISNILLNIKDMSFFGFLSSASCVRPVRWNRVNQSNAKQGILICVS